MSKSQLNIVFNMICKTKALHPSICKQGLQYFLDVMQGLQSRDLSDKLEAMLKIKKSAKYDARTDMENWAFRE